MNLSEFEGVYSALITPYDKKGRINLDMQSKIINFHIKNGIKGLYLCGSTGEGPMLETEERILISKNAIDTCKKKMKTIVHVGHICTDTAITLAKQAHAHGADAISSVQPYYYDFSEEIKYR